MSLFVEYVRTNLAESFLSWKKGEVLKKLGTASIAALAAATAVAGYTVTFTPEAGQLVAIGFLTWLGFLVLIVTPFRIWCIQRQRVLELETAAATVLETQKN